MKASRLETNGPVAFQLALSDLTQASTVTAVEGYAVVPAARLLPSKCADVPPMLYAQSASMEVFPLW